MPLCANKLENVPSSQKSTTQPWVMWWGAKLAPNMIIWGLQQEFATLMNTMFIYLFLGSQES